MAKKSEIISRGEIVRIERENAPVVSKANKMIVATVDAADIAYDILKTIKERLKIIENKRTSITQPLNLSLRNTNEMFKKLAKPLKEADAIIGNKILKFQEIQDEKAAKKQAKLEEKAAVAAENGDEEKAEKFAEKAEAVEADAGESVTQKRWTYDVIKLGNVPRKFLMIDATAVNEAINVDGVRAIPGLKIYQKRSMSVR